MKNFLLTISFIALTAPMFVLAQSTDITALMAQIKALQEQLNALQAAQGQSSTQSVSSTESGGDIAFDNDLVYRGKNNDPEEVSALQDFLAKQGYLKINPT